MSLDLTIRKKKKNNPLQIKKNVKYSVIFEIIYGIFVGYQV